MDIRQAEVEIRERPIPWGRIAPPAGVLGGLGAPLLAAMSPLMPVAFGPSLALMMGAGTAAGAGVGAMVGAARRSPPLVMAPRAVAGGIQLGLQADGTAFAWRDEHIPYSGLVCGQSGAGKTEFLKQVFVEQAARGGGGVFVDAKSEPKTVKQLRAIMRLLGREESFRVLLPGDPDNSNTINVYQHGGAEQLTDMVVNLHRLPGNAGVQHWRGLQANLVTAVIESLQIMGRPWQHGDLVAGICSPRARERLIRAGKWRGYTRLAEVVFGYRRGGQIDEGALMESVSGIVWLLRRYTAPGMDRIFLTERGEIDLRDVVTKGGLVYVGLDVNRTPTGAYDCGHLVANAFAGVVGEVLAKGLKNRKPVVAIWDELPKYLSKGIADAYTTWRAARVGTLGAVQSLGQLEEAGEVIAREILSNSGLKLFFRQECWEDAEAAATELGKEIQLQHGYSEGNSQGSGGMAMGPVSRTRGYSRSRSVREKEEYVVRPERLRGFEMPTGVFWARWMGGHQRARSPLLEFPPSLLEELNEEPMRRYPTSVPNRLGLWEEYQNETLAAMGRVFRDEPVPTVESAELQDAEDPDEGEAAGAAS